MWRKDSKGKGKAPGKPGKEDGFVPPETSVEKGGAEGKEDKEGVSDNKGGAKAPGKPSEEDGFIPPKKWNGQQSRHEDSGRFGWKDKKGNHWIPSGPNGHGGPHWDVQLRDGGYKNILPGGKVRGAK